MKEKRFCLDFMVRDDGCGMRGMVNIGVYQNYLENAQREYNQGMRA